MYIATLPFFPLVKQVYDMEKIPVNETVMMQLYPEIYACIGCNACTKACTQGLNVMQYIAYAQRGDFEKCAEESFDCVMCGVCSSRCPAGITHGQVGLLSRRLTGKYLAPETQHLLERVAEIENGATEEALRDIMNKTAEELKEMYNNRDFEK
jgi:Na+-translocating ferredoxin:NAD+ oxidoreductase RnfC subunit